MLVVVSDTSPIRCLAHVGHLALLDRFFTTVVIPPAVMSELQNSKRGDIWHRVKCIPCVRVQTPGDQAAVHLLYNSLDLGEAEAIALAAEIHADAILMDERRGRAECARRGLRTLGVLGLLARAKSRGYVPEIKSLIDSLCTTGGFHVSSKVRRSILRMCGEAD